MNRIGYNEEVPQRYIGLDRIVMFRTKPVYFPYAAQEISERTIPIIQKAGFCSIAAPSITHDNWLTIIVAFPNTFEN